MRVLLFASVAAFAFAAASHAGPHAHKAQAELALQLALQQAPDRQPLPPAVRDCPCSPACECGCNDGLPCRCGNTDMGRRPVINYTMPIRYEAPRVRARGGS